MTIHAHARNYPHIPVAGQCEWFHDHEDVDLTCDSDTADGGHYCTQHRKDDIVPSPTPAGD